MALNLRAYESQAKVSVALGLLGGLAALAAIFLIARNFHLKDFWVLYQQDHYLYTVLAAIGVACLVSVIGFFVGLHSAGQKRNTQSKLSWTGFFINSLVLAMSLSAGAFFFLTRYRPE